MVNNDIRNRDYNIKWNDITNRDDIKNRNWEKSGIDPEWVGHIYESDDGAIRLVTFKGEYYAEVAKAMKEELVKAGIMGADRIDPDVPEIAKDQLEYLWSHYDPKNMDSDTYRKFVDDLIRLGILSSEERKYLLFEDTLPDPGGIAIVPDTFMEPPYDFDSCKGNVFELARFHEQFEWCAPESYKHYRSARSLSFGKLLNVLHQMGIRY